MSRVIKEPKLEKIVSNLCDFLEHLHDSDIRYCHFKSNAHLLEGMCGITDLDILIDRNRYTECIAFLTNSGFKRFTTSSLISYPGVEDWLGFDEKTGSLTHLHLHWQMVAGEPNLKGYHLPWEKDIFDSRIWDEEHGIFTSSPEMEMILLLVRAVLKLRTRDFLKQLLGKSYPSPQGDIVREFDWLLERADVAKVHEFASRLMSPKIANQIDKILQKGLSGKRPLHDFRRDVFNELKPYNTYNFVYGRLYRWSREFTYRGLSFLSTRFGILSARRRGPATGGLIIVFLGADGSGKSTQASDVVKWLGWKAGTVFVYLGSGDGEVSLIRKLLVNAKNIITGSRVKPHLSIEKSKQKRGAPSQGGLKRLYYAFWALSLAREKYVRLLKATRARNKGMIVVCDRYPQNQIKGFNDGPLLTEWQNDSWLWETFFKLEAKAYVLAELLPPDMVIKLNVSEAVAAKRKTDTPTEMINKKIEAVKQLSFEPSCRVIEVDADQELEQVTQIIRHEIWHVL